MVTRNVFILGLAIFLYGCTSYEGLYAPSCIAYAGSEIRLADGRYAWTKFTDQVVVDEDGNTVDPFPGFPREGRYERQGNRVTLAAGPDSAPETMFLLEDNGDVYLYSTAEWNAFETSGKRPACPLKRQPAN